MKKLGLVALLTLVAVPAFAETLTSREVKQCVQMSKDVDQLLDVIERHDNRIQRADRVLYSYGCYKTGTAWRCNNLSPEGKLNAKTTVGARNESVRIKNRSIRERNTLGKRYNRQCTNVTVRQKDVDNACRFEDTFFCNQID